MIKRLTQKEKEKIINLYRTEHNCVQIKNIMGLKGHQQVLNVITKLPDYIPYKYGRNSKRLYHANFEFFKTINTEEKAYILGFICADGNVDPKSHTLNFTVQTLDKDILEKIKISMNANNPIKDIIRKTPFNYGKPLFYHSRLRIASKELVSHLLNKGLDNNKTYNLNSDIINYVPKKLIRHFLRGYFDGDGNVILGYKYSSGIKYNINVYGNYEFLINTFGKYFPTTNKYSKDKYSKQCYAYRLSSKKNTINFLNYIYSDSTIYLNRKYNIYLKTCAQVKSDKLLENPEEDNQQPI